MKLKLIRRSRKKAQDTVFFRLEQSPAGAITLRAFRRQGVDEVANIMSRPILSILINEEGKLVLQRHNVGAAEGAILNVSMTERGLITVI